MKAARRIGTIAASINEESDTIEDVMNPFYCNSDSWIGRNVAGWQLKELMNIWGKIFGSNTMQTGWTFKSGSGLFRCQRLKGPNFIEAKQQYLPLHPQSKAMDKF
ncbi:MAG: hypothetical protein CM1200mP3_10840 [Chloroflexota bacterium]|nr:MAG: hypothetical protein CM1200mP3_10840 [Chloroflexota bacterium]